MGQSFVNGHAPIDQPAHATKGSTLLVQSLQRNGVTTVFGLPGLQLDHIFDSLYDVQQSIRVVHTRHEQSAAYMAFGYAQARGEIGTCLVVPGPGVFNAMGALCTAYACNSPVLCVTSQIPSAFINMGMGFLHEVPNQLGALASVSKWQGAILSAASAPAVMAEAFWQLRNGRPRPVVVEIPPDITMETCRPVSVWPSRPASSPTQPDTDLLAQAAKELGHARNPAIFVGSGVFGAESELRELAELLQAPVIMSEHGAGALSARHPLAQNMQTGNDLWPSVDVALAVGTRFFHPAIEWGRDEYVKLIRIDIDPAQSLRPWAPDIHVVADAKAALLELARMVPRHNRRRDSRLVEFQETKAAKEAELAGILKPQFEYTRVIRQALPDDGIVCFDVGQMHFYSWWGYPAYHARTVIQPGYQGTLGYGYPTALGAQVGRRDRKVIYVGGDGGFLFNAQEVSTAIRFGINVVAIVFNDNAYGNVKRIQAQQFGGRLIASDLTNPDFIKFADSFGIRGYRVHSPMELAQVLPGALKADEPSIIEVVVNEPFPNPFPYMFFRKCRG